MKKSYVLAVVLSFCILFSVSVNSSQAAWYDDCTINMSGSLDGVGYVYLSCAAPTLTLAWYQLGRNATEANQGLAVVLTAVSLEKKVGLDLTSGIIRCVAVKAQ